MAYAIQLRLILALVLSVIPFQIAIAVEANPSETNSEASSLELSTRQTQQLEAFNQNIAALESAFGPYDPALVEPLQGLTELLIAAGDFEGAGRILNRHLQLIRVDEGPTSPSQFSVIEELIRNNIRQSRWQEVTENFASIHFIQTQNSNVDTVIQLNAKNAIRAWHHTAIYLDEPSSRIRHFRDSRRLQREQLREAEKIFGEESPDLIPWLYNDAIERHRVVAFITSKDELGADAKDRIVRAEHKSRENYLREGLHIVKRIRRIVETMDNAEAEAMAMLYEADFQMLMNLGTATRDYRDAMDKFEEAGITQEEIAAFFARPVVLPVAAYHLSMNDALAAQTAYGYTVTSNQDDEEATVHMGDFIAWNESLPSTRRPLIPEQASALTTELNSVDVRLNISSRGLVRTPKVLLSEPDSVSVRRDAKDAIEHMQFRPKFEGRRWRRIQRVTMRYLYPPPL